MNESSKTNALRGNEFHKLHLRGKVLDIGAGKDAVCPHAEIFDQQHGDANHIDSYFESSSFDTVHSSHCLEHMRNPEVALQKWWALVKPDGFLITVVPDEDLYEQGIWPSFFNDDHISTFRLNKQTSWSPVSHDLIQIHLALPGAALISAERHNQHYDLGLLFDATKPPKRLKHPLKLLWSVCKRVTSPESKVRLTFQKWLVRQGHPFDQTVGKALAQLQVVIQKM
jgi:SAM-dependent methyltransferase